MTRREEWMMLTASALAAGLTPQAARLAADETLAECDERFPGDRELRMRDTRLFCSNIRVNYAGSGKR